MVCSNKRTIAYWLLVILLVCTASLQAAKKRSKKCGKRNTKPEPGKYPGLSSYPTNFFTETVHKFVNNVPIVGVVAMEMDGEKLLEESPFIVKTDYFGASFVKLVELAGGRAVPIREDLAGRKLHEMLHQLNGIVIPGGDGDLSDSGYRHISEEAIRYSRRLAKKGIPFPILGICRGSQMIMQVPTDELMLEETDSINVTLPLMMTDEIGESQLFGHAPEDLIRVLKERPITFNAHKFSVPLKKYLKNKELVDQYRILSTNYDRNGVEFISTFEDKYAPIFALQWHPEKTLFIFNPDLAIDHSIYATTSSQYIANVFMGYARQNPNHFYTRQHELENLIYRYTPYYVGNISETPYEQIYTFKYVAVVYMDTKVNDRKTKV